jgi:DUF971 family protein
MRKWFLLFLCLDPRLEILPKTESRRPTVPFCDTENNNMPTVDPKSVKVHLTAGTGVDIEWKDGHLSHYTFPYLRDACPCALCNEERAKSGRTPGDQALPKPGELPMFKPTIKPLSAEPIGKYALRFKWNDAHDLGIYSWTWLREICPCHTCRPTNDAIAG